MNEAIEACTAGADIVMLDNFTPEGAKDGAAVIKKSFPHVLVEVSGGNKMSKCTINILCLLLAICCC